MSLKLYNTLSREIEEFHPIDPQRVKIYTCGPTVYSSPHIGNFAAYVYWDLLLRVLKFNGFTPYRVLNLTDVGHLSSDADDGEDKLEKGARKTGKSVWDVAKYYSDEFLRDFQKLNLIEPNVIARATDYIPQDLELVQILIDKGYTYETKDGIYFDTSKFPHYADFARLDLENLKAGARVEFSSEKRNPSDFALWKFIQPGEKHDMRWDFLGRPGYPGWHIECSAIIHDTLGEPIDIHTGGIDHIPVHHTNEIAQSEAAFDKKLANYWLHCNHLTSEGQKLSKSLGNSYTISELEEKGYSPLDFKMWVLQGHYRSERDFSIESLEAARIRRLNWRNRVAESYQNDPVVDDYETKIAEVIDALNNDLNSAQAFAVIDKIKSSNIVFWQTIERLFGLGLFKEKENKNNHNEKEIDEITSKTINKIKDNLHIYRDTNIINSYLDMYFNIYKKIINNKQINKLVEKIITEKDILQMKISISVYVDNMKINTGIYNKKDIVTDSFCNIIDTINLEKTSKQLELILKKRLKAKKIGDYNESDQIRDNIKEKYDLNVLDTSKNSQIWQYLK